MGCQSWINECEVIIHWWKSGVLWRMTLLAQRTQQRRAQPWAVVDGIVLILCVVDLEVSGAVEVVAKGKRPA